MIDINNEVYDNPWTFDNCLYGWLVWLLIKR